jgi:FkbM family methyltransferase
MRLLGVLLRPYFWLELPAWGRLYRRTVGDYVADPLWAGAGVRPLRGKLHGFAMEMNLGQWSERFTWFLGRHYDLALQLLLRRTLGPGDRFCDVGANIGMISLVAAHCVGPSGAVIAFEPNPRCVDRIARWKSLNGGIPQLSVRPCAVSDAPGELILSVPRSNSGEGTLTSLGPEGPDPAVDRVPVPVRVGDEELRDRPGPIRVLKMDVEGWEIHALRGLAKTLETDRPILAIEAIPQHLARAGHTVDDLGAFLEPRGYRPYAMQTRRRLLRHRLDLPAWPGAKASPNMAWIHRDDPLLPDLVS